MYGRRATVGSPHQIDRVPDTAANRDHPQRRGAGGNRETVHFLARTVARLSVRRFGADQSFANIMSAPKPIFPANFYKKCDRCCKINFSRYRR